MSANTWFLAALLTVAVPAAAQPPDTTSQQSTTTQSSDERGRVATTVNGDAGLWWVPVGDTNTKGMWRGSIERNSRNTPQGHMNVATFTGNVSYGFAEHADFFAAWDVIQRVDRDLRSLFVASDPERGGLDTRLPYSREPWTGNKLGDLRVGAKFGLLSEATGSPASAALIAAVNLPVGDSDNGAGQGSIGVDLSGVLSRWVSSKAVISGTAGYNLRKNPSDPVVVHVPNNFHWGFGLGITPTTSWLIHAEVLGDHPVRDNAAVDTPLVAEDGSIAPSINTVDRQTSFTTGLTWFANNGFFIGAELRWDFPMLDRVNAPDDSRSDYLDYHVRFGWSPIKRQPPPPVVTPPPPPPPVVRAHELSVKAACDPCTVEVGRTSIVTATPFSSIGCVVTYAWSAPTGTFADRTAQKTTWTAPMQVGAVPVTVTVTCPSDGKTASDTVTIQVIRTPAKVYTFEDVHFDFDRYTLRQEAVRVLEGALAAMKENPTLRLTLEGHTCSIGTAEYNLALGERRSNAVRDYLTSNGIAANRVTSVSYGEERPKHDNSREETRRLNRRAALVVRLDQ